MTTRFFGATVLTALAMTTLLGQDSNLIAVGAKVERVATVSVSKKASRLLTARLI